MESAGRKVTNHNMLQGKFTEIFPEVELSAKQIKGLLAKSHNEMFGMQMQVRVTGIREYESGDGSKETFYTVEIKEADVESKAQEDMTPEEILARIEEDQD